MQTVRPVQPCQHQRRHSLKIHKCTFFSKVTLSIRCSPKVSWRPGRGKYLCSYKSKEFFDQCFCPKNLPFIIIGTGLLFRDYLQYNRTWYRKIYQLVHQKMKFRSNWFAIHYRTGTQLYKWWSFWDQNDISLIAPIPNKTLVREFNSLHQQPKWWALRKVTCCFVQIDFYDIL